jgi:hypothetical protein
VFVVARLRAASSESAREPRSIVVTCRIARSLRDSSSLSLDAWPVSQPKPRV